MARYRLVPLLLILLLLTLAGCATGSVIVTGAARAPLTPEQVTIYLEPPAEFEVIGLVNASSDAGWTDQGSVNYAIKELKKKAAKLGANGVLLVASGETTTAIVGGGTNLFLGVPVTAKTVQGKAIFVKGK